MIGQQAIRDRRGLKLHRITDHGCFVRGYRGLSTNDTGRSEGDRNPKGRACEGRRVLSRNDKSQLALIRQLGTRQGREQNRGRACEVRRATNEA